LNYLQFFFKLKGKTLTEKNIKEKLEEHLFLAHGYEILRAECKIYQEVNMNEFDLDNGKKINEYIHLEKIGECQIKF